MAPPGRRALLWALLALRLVSPALPRGARPHSTHTLPLRAGQSASAAVAPWGSSAPAQAHRWAMMAVLRGGEPWAPPKEEEEENEESEYESAGWVYKEVLSEDPVNADALCSLGSIKFEKEKKYDEAEGLFHQGLQHQPLHARTLLSLGLLNVVTEKLERATHFFRRAVEADPTSLPAVHSYARLLHSHVGDIPKAEEMYKLGARLNPQHAGILSDFGIFLEFVKHDREAATGLYKLAYLANPASPDTLNNRARTLESFGRHDEVHAMYREALGLCPQHVPVLCNYGRFLYCNARPRDPERAEEYYLRALSVLPNHVDTLVNCAVLFMEKTEARKAHEMLSLAIKTDPHKVSALCTMGVILETRAHQLYREQDEESGRMERNALLRRAEELYTQALALEPNHVDTLCNRAALLHCHRGEPGKEEAEALYRRVLDINPNHSGAMYNFAFLRQSRGDITEAMHLYERAYEINPAKEAYRLALAQFTQSKYAKSMPEMSRQDYDPVDERLREHSQHWGHIKTLNQREGRRLYQEDSDELDRLAN